MATSIQAAKDVLREAAVPEVLEAAEELIAMGVAGWRVDPYVDGVVGLLHVTTDRALIIVYVDQDDFETSAEFDELMS